VTAPGTDVDRILAQRARRAGHGREVAGLAAAVVLHALLVMAALLLPRLQPRPKPLEFVPVTVIPAQALGVHRPAPPRRAPEAAAAEEAPAKPPEPAPKARQEEPAKPLPKPETQPQEKPADKAPVLPVKPDIKPDKKADQKPDPKAVKPSTAPPAPQTPSNPPAKTPPGTSRNTGGGNPNSPPNATATGETGDQAGRRGGSEGTPLGTTAFGSHIAGVDNPDFTYGYYLDRLLSLIDANWSRPTIGGGAYAIITFHINRDGSLSDLRVGQSSGYNSFDLAALRAVQNAAPFPPLPRAYNHDDLGIHLIVK
jgi:TonB family protein